MPSDALMNQVYHSLFVGQEGLEESPTSNSNLIIGLVYQDIRRRTSRTREVSDKEIEELESSFALTNIVFNYGWHLPRNYHDFFAVTL
jgi:hypothetical protein